MDCLLLDLDDLDLSLLVDLFDLDLFDLGEDDDDNEVVDNEVDIVIIGGLVWMWEGALISTWWIPVDCCCCWWFVASVGAWCCWCACICSRG